MGSPGGEEWPLDAELVVVDETSMLDVELAAALLEACADGTHLLLVGDPAQLPSIGPGPGARPTWSSPGPCRWSS